MQWESSGSRAALHGRASGATPAARRAAWPLRVPGPTFWQVKGDQSAGARLPAPVGSAEPVIRGPGAGRWQGGAGPRGIVRPSLPPVSLPAVALRRGELEGLWVWLCCWLCEARLGGASPEIPAQIIKASKAFFNIYIFFIILLFLFLYLFFRK